MYSALIADIDTNYSHDALHAKSIRDISISITNLTHKLEQINKSREMKIHTNEAWVINLMSEFQKNLQEWIHHHKEKLSDQSESMEDEGIAPVQLAKQRIDFQINAYAKL